MRRVARRQSRGDASRSRRFRPAASGPSSMRRATLASRPRRSGCLSTSVSAGWPTSTSCSARAAGAPSSTAEIAEQRHRHVLRLVDEQHRARLQRHQRLAETDCSVRDQLFARDGVTRRRDRRAPITPKSTSIVLITSSSDLHRLEDAATSPCGDRSRRPSARQSVVLPMPSGAVSTIGPPRLRDRGEHVLAGVFERRALDRGTADRSTG